MINCSSENTVACKISEDGRTVERCLGKVSSEIQYIIFNFCQTLTFSPRNIYAMVSATAQNRSMTSLGAHLEVCSVLAADFDRSIVVFTAALVDIMKARERERVNIH